MNSVEAYVEALEAEHTKMMMFQNELPLSIQLVSQTIDSCKGRFSFEDVDVPVLEFIPLEKNCTNSDEMIKPTDDDADDDAMGKKSDWLSSAQLWNKSPDSQLSISEEETPDALVESLVDKCESSDKEKSEERSSSPKKAESSSESQKSGAGCKKDDKAVSGTSKRKQRRCWSQDLHRRFLNSLKQLGGAHAATPKQIRELMKVDGLTNDEVKSHLQKYRLHTSNPNSLSSQRKPQEPPQFVVVGNIWAPPSEYADMAFTTPTNWNSGTSITRVYTPMAAPPPSQPHPRQEPTNQKSQIKSKNPQGLNDALGRCISSSISSSTSTTASRVY